MGENEIKVKRDGDEERNCALTGVTEEALKGIGPIAKRIMEAQPLNPFKKLEIKIVSRGALF